MWFIVILVLILLWIYKLTSPSTRLWELAEKVPGPKAYPIIGSTYMFLLTTKTNIEITADLIAKYGPVMRMWVGNRLVFLLSDPDDMEIFLSSTKFLDKPFSYRLLDSWLGDTNLLTSNGDIWRLHRKLLTPSFHFKILENSVPMMLRNGKYLCDKLEARVDQDGFDIEQYIEKSTLDIISETAMGIKLETQLSNNSVYLDCIKNVSTILLKRFFSPWLQWEPLFKLTRSGRTYYKNLGIIKEEGRKVIKRRKSLLENRLENLEETEDGEGRKQMRPFLDFVLTQGSFNDREIENEVQTFMFAGHDTTKSAISFCLYTLAHHQDIQEKLATEIRETLPNIGGEPTYQDFLGLKYLENVIKESLRLHPPVGFISRKIDEDIKLSSGYVLPAGSTADISIFFVHRNNKYFSNPEKFIPERFEEKDTKRNPYCYIPFSAGPRNCIGQKFAMLEMRIILSLLILKYRFLPDEQAKPLLIENALVLRSKNKLPVRIQRRDVK
nr:cytochrome P450 4NV1 [Phenacoccus solenopsis]